MPVCPGTVIAERYIVEARIGQSGIGQGGMGQVYRATQSPLGRPVALKLFHDDRTAILQRVIREARVAAALVHPHAVQVYDVGRVGSLIYIAMEFVHGSLLRELGPGPLSLVTTLELAAQLVDLLAAAHQLSLVHRDLKPSNIFVERDREGRMYVRVVDFGLAFIAGDAHNGRMTEQGILVGTPAYLAPEQAQGGEVGPPADIYALGCILYELLTGLPVFMGSPMYVVTQQVHVAPVPPRQRVPEVEIPLAIEALVMRMLDKQPQRRPSAAQLVSELAVLRGEIAGVADRRTDRPDRPCWPDRPRRSHEDRAARMVSVPVSPVPAPAGVSRSKIGASKPGEIVVGVVGELDPMIRHGMVVNGFIVETIEDDAVGLDSCEILLTTDLAPGRLEALVDTGLPVLVASGGPRMELLADLLRRGVSGVVASPFASDELTRALRRAVVRTRRR
ncbi:MAG: serine/threonine-protein kinase [Myxococcota bacterium]